MKKRRLSVCVWLCVLGCDAAVRAQALETQGERALGMGGAFVAVADDSTATWWNPAALASGPFLDLAIGWSGHENRADGEPRDRTRVTAVSLATPPLGVSYYHLSITDVQPASPTATASGGREDGQAGVVRSLRLHDVGVTLLTSLFSGVHVGTTLKFLHGHVEHTTGDGSLPPDALLDLGEDATGARAQGQFDADLGVLAVSGPLRVGALVRNVRAAAFDDGSGAAAGSIRLPRQARVGVAFDGALRRSKASPWVLSADVDVMRYTTGAGDRRVIAAGAERWLFGERLGIRGGGRFNQVGAKERSATAGVTAAIRSGVLVEAHVVGGGEDDERGWGLAARVTF